MIYTYLDLSTGHLSVETRSLLDGLAELPPSYGTLANAWPAMTIAAYTYGYFVTVPALNIVEVRQQAEILPADLRACLEHAHTQGIHLLRFDEGGDALHCLEVFDE
jgi:hypothetical protein